MGNKAQSLQFHEFSQFPASRLQLPVASGSVCGNVVIGCGLTSRTQSPDLRPQSAAGVPAATSHTYGWGEWDWMGYRFSTKKTETETIVLLCFGFLCYPRIGVPLGTGQMKSVVLDTGGGTGNPH